MVIVMAMVVTAMCNGDDEEGEDEDEDGDVRQRLMRHCGQRGQYDRGDYRDRDRW